MLPRFLPIQPIKAKASKERRARLGDARIVLLGERPRVGARLATAFAVLPVRSVSSALTQDDLSAGVVVVSTLPNIRAHACHVQVLDLEEMLPRYLPTARLCHVTSDGVDAWREVDEYHPNLCACGYTLEGVAPAARQSFGEAFGVGVQSHSRVAHGLFLLVNGIFRLVHIPRQQLGSPNVSAFLRRSARIVRALESEAPSAS
jgi:hypothetical protein